MRIVLVVVAILALIGFLAVAVVLPQMAGAEAQAAAQALIAGTRGVQQQITTNAEKTKSLAGAGKDLKIAEKEDAKAGKLKWVVSPNGEIRGWNEKNALEISLLPTLKDGKVSWRCRGYPNTAMPASCGGQ